MKTNTPNKYQEKTHEGTTASRINAEQQLRRSVMACLLWENSFYEDGESIAFRIQSFVSSVSANTAATVAIDARNKYKLRHVPLWIVREMARNSRQRHLVADTLYEIIQRADELTEFLSLYWLDGKQPLSNQVKKGLARAFTKFDAYQLAKYNRDGAVKLRDVLFLTHAKPLDSAQEELWNSLIDGTLESPDTWEVALSGGKDKRETWEYMLQNGKLGGLALLRNLRNMYESDVNENIVINALNTMKTGRILPYRFIAAARHAVQWESYIEKAMLRALDGREMLHGKTVILVDVSGSMDSPLSSKSDLMRYDAANGLAILARELCERVSVFSFSSNLVRVPDRRGFALRDAIANSQTHWSTELGAAISQLNKNEQYDRIIVITDEQSSDYVPNPNGIGYVINVASYQNGVGYGAWNHIDGFSESVFDYIIESEKLV